MGNVSAFVGLDYHDELVQVCVLDRDGRQLFNQDCANDWSFQRSAPGGRGIGESGQPGVAVGADRGGASLGPA
jgi:hypothetical protein